MRWETNGEDVQRKTCLDGEGRKIGSRSKWISKRKVMHREPDKNYDRHSNRYVQGLIYTLAAFLDVSSTYDNVNYDILLHFINVITTF